MTYGTSRPGASNDDVLWMVILGVLVVASGVLNVGALSADAVTWLLEHDVVVPDAQALLLLPGGVGLDLRRLAVVLGLALLLAAGGFFRLRRGRDVRQGPRGLS